MQIRIFDVAHGFCALVIADSGSTILIDCGHNQETGFWPSTYMRQSGYSRVNRLFVLNYDEDHISGLWRLLYEDRVPVDILHRNPTISADQLRRLKSECGPPSRAMCALLE